MRHWLITKTVYNHGNPVFIRLNLFASFILTMLSSSLLSIWWILVTKYDIWCVRVSLCQKGWKHHKWILTSFDIDKRPTQSNKKQNNLSSDLHYILTFTVYYIFIILVNRAKWCFKFFFLLIFLSWTKDIFIVHCCQTIEYKQNHCTVNYWNVYYLYKTHLCVCTPKQN